MKLEPWHVIVVLVVMFLLFGSRRLPDTARSMGRSIRIFKSEMESLRGDETDWRTADPAPLDGHVAAEPARTANVDRPSQ
jgi:sec-independent protein translocase protein TatA